MNKKIMSEKEMYERLMLENKWDFTTRVIGETSKSNMFKQDDPTRQTGRTTRMLIAAIKRAMAGGDVSVYGYSDQSATYMYQETERMLKKMNVNHKPSLQQQIRVGQVDDRKDAPCMGSIRFRIMPDRQDVFVDPAINEV